jgi:hypothetical protein
MVSEKYKIKIILQIIALEQFIKIVSYKIIKKYISVLVLIDMKILGLLLQSKKGEPLIISTSPSVLNRKIILYSNVIYENILETYRI